MASRKHRENADQLPVFGYQPIKEAIEEERDAATRRQIESEERVRRASEAADRLQEAKLQEFRVRVHPFEKHRQFERIERGEAKAAAYVETLKKWLLAKPKPLHILVEMRGVVWRLWTCTAAPVWEEERFHD